MPTEEIDPTIENIEAIIAQADAIINQRQAVADSLTLIAETATDARDIAVSSAEQAREANASTLEAADAAADSYIGAASSAARAEGFAEEARQSVLYPTGTEFIRQAVEDKIINPEGSKVAISWQADGNLKIGNSAITGTVDVWSGVVMHGKNVSHGTGAAIFIQNNIHSEMSARGFWVEDNGTRIVDLDSDETGKAYLKLNGNNVISIEEAEITLDAAGVAGTTTLKHYGVYSITIPATLNSFNLEALSIEAPSTLGETVAHLWITLEANEETAVETQEWPVFDWINEINQQLPPTLERGKTYLIAILRRGDYTAANICLSK